MGDSFFNLDFSIVQDNDTNYHARSNNLIGRNDPNGLMHDSNYIHQSH